MSRLGVGESLKACSALVLAGGLGTRLRSAYNSGPKCMAPVGGRVFFEYPLLWLRSAGIQNLVFCVGYKRSQIESWLGDGSRWGVTVTYSVEEALLGTGGALKLAEPFIIGECFFVLNGDSFLAVDLAKLYHYHTIHNSVATIAVVRQPHSPRYGTVQLASDGRIAAFQEKQPNTQAANGSDQLINGGVYLFQRRLLELIPPARPVSLENEIFPSLVGAGLYGFVTPGYFIDIGVPADFQRAQTELPERFS